MHAHEEAKRPNDLGGELARGSKGSACMPDDRKSTPRRWLRPLGQTKHTYLKQFYSINELNFVQQADISRSLVDSRLDQYWIDSDM
jgi:hypothetical protein